MKDALVHLQWRCHLKSLDDISRHLQVNHHHAYLQTQQIILAAFCPEYSPTHLNVHDAPYR